jgi:hypothetical protein
MDKPNYYFLPVAICDFSTCGRFLNGFFFLTCVANDFEIRISFCDIGAEFQF